MQDLVMLGPLPVLPKYTSLALRHAVQPCKVPPLAGYGFLFVLPSVTLCTPIHKSVLLLWMRNTPIGMVSSVDYSGSSIQVQVL